MSKREYSIREKAVIDKINKVNNVLSARKIKINYSVYNYNGIASKLEKSDLYNTDVSNAVFVRVHTCDSKYMIDSVVNSCNLQNNVEIEECFNTKISDIEKANLDDLVEFFGNMDNHEIKGFGKNKEYQITYKSIDAQGQDVEIKAWYGSKNKYKIRKARTKIEKDGTIQKVYSDQAVNFDENDYGNIDEVLSQGIESRSPENYSLVEKQTDVNGNNKFRLNCIGNEDVNYQVISNDDKFNSLDSINYSAKYSNYYEYKGKIEKASGKLACRIDVENGKVVKPNFSKVKNIAGANEVCYQYYKKYKNYPIVKIDNKSNKIIIQGKNTELYKLNFNQVEENVKNVFENYLNKGYVIETVSNSTKKYIKAKK